MDERTSDHLSTTNFANHLRLPVRSLEAREIPFNVMNGWHGPMVASKCGRRLACLANNIPVVDFPLGR